MPRIRDIDKSLSSLTFRNREEGFQHHTYDADLLQYEYMKNGSMQALAEGKKMFEGPTNGTLSDNLLTHYKYLFVAATTLSCRFCVEGGLDTETAFNLSDLYIRAADKCKTVQEIFDLHDTMFEDYTKRMQKVQREHVYSLPVIRCMDYISQHLHEPLTQKDLAEVVNVSPSHLSTIFKKETGCALSEYVRIKRIDAAKMLLQYFDYSITDIAEYLAFSSDSHFIQVFKKNTGITPAEYRKQRYRTHFDGE